MKKWWGYYHVNGSLFVRPAVWTNAMDIEDAEQSPFIAQVIYPFQAEDYKDALREAKRRKTGAPPSEG